jgi:hypothetical protein
MYDVSTFAMVANGAATLAKLQEIITTLTERIEQKVFCSKVNAKRVLISG